MKTGSTTNVHIGDSLQVLADKNKLLLERYDPDESIKQCDAVALDAPYHHVPQKTEDLWSAVKEDFGEDGFETFQKITMLRLMERFETRAIGKRYSDSILERFEISFRRIVRSIRDESFVHYRSNNDILLKDLAICRQKVFPAGGARVVEPKSGFPRSLMLQGGLRQALRVSWWLLRLGGNKPFYSHHTHLGELDEFNREDFERCNLRLADMLKLNPEVKGVHCGSWLYDPALESVSPRLSYMRVLQQTNGAIVLYAGISIDGGALAKSKARRALYEQGRYIPKSYHIIWPRRQLIGWADGVAKSASNSRLGKT